MDDLQKAFLDEANHALRQVLFQLGARIELALVKRMQSEPGQGLDDHTAESLMDAVGRATQIVDVFLDRSRAVQFAIALHPEAFSLDSDVNDMLQWNGFLDDPDNVELDLQHASLVADRERIRDVLGHMAARFWFSRTPPEKLVVRVHPTADKGAEGFIGLSRSHLHAEDLIEEIDHPLSIEAMEIDTPYTRAVLERHGGTLYVASDEHQTTGFGFTLPPEPVDEEYDSKEEKQHAD